MGDGMDVRSFRGRLQELGYPVAPATPAEMADELYPFTVVSRDFLGPFRAAVRDVVDGGDSAGGVLAALATLMEETLADGEDATADALATRVVDPVLCRDPAGLASARPYLGPTTLRVVDKMVRLIAAAEAAVAASREEAPAARPAADAAR